MRKTQAKTGSIDHRPGIISYAQCSVLGSRARVTRVCRAETHWQVEIHWGKSPRGAGGLDGSEVARATDRAARKVREHDYERRPTKTQANRCSIRRARVMRVCRAETQVEIHWGKSPRGAGGLAGSEGARATDRAARKVREHDYERRPTKTQANQCSIRRARVTCVSIPQSEIGQKHEKIEVK